MSHINFEIFLFLFVIITSGIFYLPINRWEYKISEKNRIALKKNPLPTKKVASDPAGLREIETPEKGYVAGLHYWLRKPS